MKRFTKKTTLAFLLLCLFSLLAVFCACKETTVKQPSPTITYETGTDGVSIPPFSAEAGSKIYPPTDPSREGYRFDGWELNGEIFPFETMPDTDITLTAVWSKLYIVSFETGVQATQIPSAEYAEGEQIALPENPTRAHYKFGGWTLDGEPFSFGVMPSRDIRLCAEWTEASTIVFDTGTDDFTLPPLTETAGAKISAPSVSRPGYYLRYWKLNGEVYNFSVMPDEDITLVAEWVELTNLPAMFIDLSDGSGNAFPLSSVTREEYVSSTISLVNSDSKFILNSVASNFKGRGNGSWTESGDKKGYKIKFDKKQSLFSRASNKHWVIIACTNFDDITMSRNYLAYNMADEVFTGIEYSTQARWIDVYVNGEYRGVYLLCEHVRVGVGRVDIESDYGVQDTGYLVEYDAYASGEEGVDYFLVEGLKYPFTVHSPDPEEYLEEGGISKAAYQKQVAYIKDYVTRVYKAALNGDFTTFSQLADVNSFVDMYILHELFKNADTGYSSFYLYKKPNGKLYAGPPWDFDATTTATRGDTSPQGIYVAGSVSSASSHTASELYIALYKTEGFKGALTARWKELSPAIRQFLDERLNDGVYEENKEAMGKNFALWKGKSQSAAETDWVNDVKALKQWLLERIAWLDNEWK